MIEGDFRITVILWCVMFLAVRDILVAVIGFIEELKVRRGK